MQVLEYEGEVRAEVHTEELDDIRVADPAEEEAFVTEAFPDGGAVDAGHRAAGKYVVQPLRDTRHTVDFHFIHSPKTARCFLFAVLQAFQVRDRIAS